MGGSNPPGLQCCSSATRARQARRRAGQGYGRRGAHRRDGWVGACRRGTALEHQGHDSPRPGPGRSLLRLMLTDYHVHLRRDEPEFTAEESFTAANAERYVEVACERGVEARGVSEHVHRFRQALDVWQHPFWRESARDDLDAYCEFVRNETSLALGIEADFVPGREDRMATLLDARDWDYVV